MKYIPNSSSDTKEMLSVIGLNSIEELFKDLPQEYLIKDNLNLDNPLDEISLVKDITSTASLNKSGKIFLGAGAYNHYIPAVVEYVVSRGEFLTAYTPYQAEVSQGTLQAIYEYQSMICELTGMEVANASMYDGSTALAEAMLMCCNTSRNKKIAVSKAINPKYIEVLKTYANANDIEIIYIENKELSTDLKKLEDNITSEVAGFLVQSPNFFGNIEDLSKINEIVKNAKSSLVVSVVEPTSLGLLKTPGECGADIVVGEGQSFGNAMNFGGPFLGIFACSKKFMRKMPGRLVGKTHDADGKVGYTLTLSAREQHIRREKATSNICSNQNLCAVAASVYLSLIGKRLSDISEQCLSKTHYLAEKIDNIDGYTLLNKNHFYNEFVIKCQNITSVIKALQEKGIIGGYDLSNDFPELKDCLLFCVTEMNSIDEIDFLIDVLKEVKGK